MDSGVVVQFHPDTYPLNTNTTCVTLRLQGTDASQFVFRSVGPLGSMVFDGGLRLDSIGLSTVKNTATLKHINPSTRSKLKVMHVRDGTWDGSDHLSRNGVPLTASRWPNTGQGYLRKVLAPGSSWRAYLTLALILILTSDPDLNCDSDPDTDPGPASGLSRWQQPHSCCTMWSQYLPAGAANR